jgi:peptidoglycan/xylan/chitin deacetylase (PgdA/CDA1 family)
MLVCNQRVPVLDYFRVPYNIETSIGVLEEHPLAALAWLEDGKPIRALAWPRSASYGIALDRHRLGSASVIAPLVTDATSESWRAELGSGWQSLVEIRNTEGMVRASIWRDVDGNMFLPFDPSAACEAVLSERYREGLGSASAARARARAAAARAYYLTRPLIPRRLQIGLRRIASGAQTRTTFPDWPIDASLHDLYDLVLGLVANLAQRPVPYIFAWPNSHAWALVLTHDVETSEGYAHLDRLRGVELDLGLRSSWNFVPRRYEVSDSVVRGLQDEGHEVGVHGLYHDGRDLGSRALLAKRLPPMQEAARRWGAVGFRSPALRRSVDLMPLLAGFDYDSSYPDSDPHGPDGGGCCSWLPYMIDGLVELPVTLPQDHTLFEILQHADGGAWHRKTAYLRARGAMALLITHPDYMLDDQRLHAYREFLETFASDASVWKALPHEVSSWWRRRMASRVVSDNGDWRVDGAAAGEATIAYAEPRSIREAPAAT